MDNYKARMDSYHKWLNFRKESKGAEFKNEVKDGRGVITMYGFIDDMIIWGDEITPESVKTALDEMEDVKEIDVFINSPGGSVFAGQTIRNMLQRHPAKITAYVDGMAASIASVILQGADERVVYTGSMVMIHSASSFAWGNAAELRDLADILDKVDKSIQDVYMEKVNIDQEKLQDLMEATTYMNADEAVDMGFADRLDKGKKVEAKIKDHMLVMNGQALEMDTEKFTFQGVKPKDNGTPEPAPAPAAAAPAPSVPEPEPEPEPNPAINKSQRMQGYKNQLDIIEKYLQLQEV